VTSPPPASSASVRLLASSSPPTPTPTSGDYAMGWYGYLDRFGAERGCPPAAPPDWDTFLATVGPACGRPPG
jgi:hypothetical protein